MTSTSGKTKNVGSIPFNTIVDGTDVKYGKNQLCIVKKIFPERSQSEQDTRVMFEVFDCYVPESDNDGKQHRMLFMCRLRKPVIRGEDGKTYNTEANSDQADVDKILSRKLVFDDNGKYCIGRDGCGRTIYILDSD